MTHIEIEKGPDCLVTGDVKEVDESFYHAFGTENQTSFEVENLQVLVWIDGFEYDLVPNMEPHRRQWFVDEILEYAQKKGLLSA